MALFGACEKAKTADSSARDLTSEVDTGKNPIAVTIAIPCSQNGERVIQYSTTAPHFHVLVSNVSEQPQKIWKEWCSWGYYALSFNLTDPDGKSWKVTKNMPHAWQANGPDNWTISPHESLVIDVDFADSATWQPFPHPKEWPQTFTMQAIFEAQPDEWSKKLSVWTGRIVSKADKYTFYH
jgi:hypothetical protein